SVLRRLSTAHRVLPSGSTARPTGRAFLESAPGGWADLLGDCGPVSLLATFSPRAFLLRGSSMAFAALSFPPSPTSKTPINPLLLDANSRLLSAVNRIPA